MIYNFSSIARWSETIFGTNPKTIPQQPASLRASRFGNRREHYLCILVLALDQLVLVDPVERALRQDGKVLVASSDFTLFVVGQRAIAVDGNVLVELGQLVHIVHFALDEGREWPVMVGGVLPVVVPKELAAGLLLLVLLVAGHQTQRWQPVRE